ncbi:MAG: hypothetical protein ABIY50_03260, partial [Ignavibacteria bacterium]
MIEYFVKLTREEVSQFKKFVSSPYFNSNKKVILLGNYLCSRYPVITAETLNKKKIHHFIFRNQKYNDTNFRKLISDFNTVFKRFLKELEFKESTHLQKCLLLRSFVRLKISDKVRHIHNEILDTDLNFFSKNIDYYTNLYLSQNAYYRHAIYDNVKEKQKSFETLCEFSDLLIIYLKLNLYQYEDELLLDKRAALNDNYGLKKEIFSLAENNLNVIKKRHPDIYFMFYEYRAKEDDVYFYELEKYCMKNMKKLK